MKYIILPTSEVTQEMVDVCCQTSLDTLRKTTDGTKALLKYLGNKPSEIEPYPVITRSQIIIELDKEEWGKTPEVPE